MKKQFVDMSVWFLREQFISWKLCFDMSLYLYNETFQGILDNCKYISGIADKSDDVYLH